MKLKRSMENGKIVFRNSETDEIVKTEEQASSSDEKKESNSNSTVLAFNILGVISILAGFILLISNVILAIITIVSSFFFFGFAEIISQLQTQITFLKRILEK